MNEVSGLVELGSFQEGTYVQGPSCQEGGNIQEEIAMMMIIEGPIEIEDPLREGDVQTKVRDPLTEEDTLIEDLLEEDIPMKWKTPGRGGYPGGGPPDEMEDPLMVEDLLVMEDPLDLLVDKDHQALKDPLDQ